MNGSNLRHLGVVGAGTMGSGIAQVAATSGLAVQVCDVAEQQLERGRAAIRAALDKAVERGKMQRGDADQSIARLAFGSDLRLLAECDFVVEAIVEEVDAKCPLHAEVGGLLRPDAILASNTSSISITKLAEASGRPDRFIGMHFFNPVPVMTLVEVVRGRATTEQVVAITEQLARRMGKTPVRANDAPGFVANRVLMPMINEAAYALAEGVADAASIDKIMVLGCNHPMGPLALADLIGVDVCLFILEVLERDTGNPKFSPCPLLRAMVADGRLGRKTGRGFFDYS